MLSLDCLALAGVVAILAFLWDLRRDMRLLSDRMSRLEGSVDELRSAIAKRKP